MTIIKRVSPLSLGKIQGIVGIITGLLSGLLAYVPGKISAITQNASQTDAAAKEFANALGIGIVIFLPIIYGILGFIAGVIGAAIYNVIAKWVGGITLELEDRE